MKPKHKKKKKKKKLRLTPIKLTLNEEDLMVIDALIESEKKVITAQRDIDAECNWKKL